MALAVVLLSSLLPICAFATLYLMSPLKISAEGVLKPLDPMQGNAERKPVDWRVDASLSKADAKRLRRPADGREELNVDILLASEPTRKFRGKVAIPAEAAANGKGENVSVQVRIHAVDGDIPGELCVPKDLLIAGSEVRLRIRADN
jgi:hypothetical protein